MLHQFPDDDRPEIDEGTQFEYGKYLQLTMGRVTCPEEAFYRAKIEIMTPNYCSVCMPALSDGMGGWCTNEFPDAISFRLRKGDSISEHILKKQYHNCHVFKNVRFLSGETINIGVCNCSVIQDFAGDNGRNSLEFIMFEIFNNSSKYSISEFNTLVQQRLGFQEATSRDAGKGLIALQCIHSQVVIDAIIGNEMAIHQNYDQLPYPAMSYFAEEFRLSND